LEAEKNEDHVHFMDFTFKSAPPYLLGVFCKAGHFFVEIWRFLGMFWLCFFLLFIEKCRPAFYDTIIEYLLKLF
jgi:hypothetical protein